MLADSSNAFRTGFIVLEGSADAVSGKGMMPSLLLDFGDQAQVGQTVNKELHG